MQLITPARRAEAAQILRLAWPVALVSLNWTLLQVTDIIVLGGISTHEVAAFGASRVITFITIMAAIGALSGILAFASRADGAKDWPGTGQVFREGLLLALLLGSAGALLLFLSADSALQAAQVADGVRGQGAAVIRIMAFAFPAQLVSIAASNFLEGVSHPRRVMIVNLTMLPLNAFLVWALAGGRLGLPMLGAQGAALATTMTIWFSASAMVFSALWLPDAKARELGWRKLLHWRDALPGAIRLGKFGVVPAIASALELAGFSWLISLSTQLGEAASHAFQIVFSVHNVTFGLAMGLGSAAGVRAGNAVGEGKPEQARSRVTIAAMLAFLLLGTAALVLGLFSSLVVSLFPATPQVALIAVAMLAVWAPFVIMDGMQAVFMFALRSLGDQVAAGGNAILAFFVVTGVMGSWLVHLGWGPISLAWASGAGMLVAALLNGGRFYLLTSALRRKS